MPNYSDEEKKKKERFESALKFALNLLRKGRLFTSNGNVNWKRLNHLLEESGDSEKLLSILNKKTGGRFEKNRRVYSPSERCEQDKKYFKQRGIELPEGITPKTYREYLNAEKRLKEKGVPLEGKKPITVMHNLYSEGVLKRAYGVDVPPGITADSLYKRFKEGIGAVANLIGLMEAGYTEEEAMKIYVTGRGRGFKKSRKEGYLKKAKEVMEKSKTIPKPERNYLKKKQRRKR